MRRIISITHVSLDGVMQAPGGPDEDRSDGFTQGGWVMPFFDGDGGRAIAETIAGGFDLLLGRRTYDNFASYWPNERESPIGIAFNAATKYVVTHRSDGLDWATSHRIGGDLTAEIRALKATEGPPLHVWGSSAIHRTLMEGELVDEYRIWIFPLLLGRGKRLFELGVPPRAFSLVSATTTASGVVMTAYRPAGPLAH